MTTPTDSEILTIARDCRLFHTHDQKKQFIAFAHKVRNAALEEAAFVAQAQRPHSYADSKVAIPIAAQIRALKTKE